MGEDASLLKLAPMTKEDMQELGLVADDGKLLQGTLDVATQSDPVKFLEDEALKEKEAKIDICLSTEDVAIFCKICPELQKKIAMLGSTIASMN